MRQAKTSLHARTLSAKDRDQARAMFSLRDLKGLWAALNRVGWQMLSIALQTRKVTPRVRRLFGFASFLVQMNKNHGETYTIKWLKACHVATMRAVAKDPVRSLREIEPGLPLPRVTSAGYPIIIGPSDRRSIQLGSPAVIRLWLSFFAIYRVLKAPMKLKTHTITEPSSASAESIKSFDFFITKNLWTWLKAIRVEPKSIRTAADPDRPYLSRAAGPNVRNALSGILADAWAWQLSPLLPHLEAFASIAGSTRVLSRFRDIVGLASRVIEKGFPLGWKRDLGIGLPASSGPLQDRLRPEPGKSGLRLGQLSFKEEAAGKLRVFAITDSWTQWLLKPLHTSIFSILNRVPADATFDQEGALNRIAEISQRQGCAYSFDLSSATDRIPILIQSHLLTVLTAKDGFGQAWANLLVLRDWWFPRNSYGLSGSVKYACGQPMGALSSWAMLALTHHLMVSYAAMKAGFPVGKFWDYAILGDDIVICHHGVAAQYQIVCAELGVEIGNKVSLRSCDPKSVALEFAKRFVLNGGVASAISFRQLWSAQSLAGRVQNLLYFGWQGLISRTSLFGVVLARFGSDVLGPFSRQIKRVGFQHGLLGALGSLYRKGMLPLELLVEACANPHDEEFDITADNLRIPSAQAMSLLNAAFGGATALGYPWSQKDARVEYRKDLSISEDLLLLSLKARKGLADTYDQTVDILSNSFLTGVTSTKYESVLRGKKVGIMITSELAKLMVLDRELAAQLRSIAELLLVGSKDPQDYYEQLLDVLQDERHEPLPLDESMKVFEDTVLYTSSFIITDTPERAYSKDEAWIALRAIRAGWPNVRVWENPTVEPWSAWSYGAP